MHKISSLILILLIFLVSCNDIKVKNACKEFVKNQITLKGISITYPKKSTLFPRDFQSPTFTWNDSIKNNSRWYVCITDSIGNVLIKEFTGMQIWKPDSTKWERLKINNILVPLKFNVIGYSKRNRNISGCSQEFQISQDSVGADIFFRAVTLPFSYAVRNVHTIEWYIGSVAGGFPRKMLDNMPVCANCHSFSNNGPTLAMDVDYGNDKGSYVIVNAKDSCLLRPEDIISWENFKKDEGDPTFGLLSQISPSGQYVLSTVKDLSVFAAVDDNLAYSQLFFPIKGIIGIYDRINNSFSELQGANNPKYVQSNPIWSPDNKKILFTRTSAYNNEKVRKSGNALLNINDIKEFKDGKKQFKFDIFSLDFNDGQGGEPYPLKEASFNEKSNYFPKYSPDGKWIVFCQAGNFMLLQPDSKLYIMNADGTNARLMNCNMSNMNSWHSWSPNGRWLVFSSKEQSLYTRLYLTHIDENGNDSPPVLLENLVFNQRAANIPEFFPGKASDFLTIKDSFSNTAPYFTRLATDNIKSKFFLKAYQNINKAIQLNPEYIDAYLLKVLLNSILQQVNSKAERAEKTKALSIVNKLISQKKEDSELLFLKASLLSSTNNYDQSEEILKVLISRSPKNYKAYQLLASIYRNNKPDMLIPVYNKMNEILPENSLEVNLLLVNHYIKNNKIEDALSLLNKLSVQYPLYEEIHENICDIYIEKKNVKGAQNEINYLIDYDSSNYRYYFLKAVIADIAGDKTSSYNYNSIGYNKLQVNLAQNKENIPLVFEKASILTRNKAYTEAIDVYNDILLVLPSNYKALKEKARIMIKLKRWPEAIKLYQKLLNDYEQEEEFYNNSAIAYINLGNMEEALSQFKLTLKLNPSNIDALYNQSKLYKMLGDNENASKDVEKIKQVLQSKKNLTESEKQLLNSL